MKTPFKYDEEKSRALCMEYSEDKEVLSKLIDRLEIEVGFFTVIPSTWGKKLKSLHMMVTVNGYTFPYYGSHVDAMAHTDYIGNYNETRMEAWKLRKKKQEERKRFRDGLLYSLLCCIRSDYHILHEDPEDLGYDSDSIKDMAKWNECKEHAWKLASALKLTQEELESLPS